MVHRYRVMTVSVAERAGVLTVCASPVVNYSDGALQNSNKNTGVRQITYITQSSTRDARLAYVNMMQKARRPVACSASSASPSTLDTTNVGDCHVHSHSPRTSNESLS